MTVPRPSSPATRGGATRNELKRAARRLFAERGIAAVGMREVVEAAGQRNAAAVHYYFGSKDDLLRELLIDGADLIEARRKALIDDAERKGAGMTLRDLVEAIVLPKVKLRGDTGEEETYFRFIVNVQNERRELFRDTVPEHSDSYRRYVDHVRRLQPLENLHVAVERVAARAERRAARPHRVEQPAENPVRVQRLRAR